MSRDNRARQELARIEGIRRYFNWFDQFPITEDVAREMYEGQCHIHTALVFSMDTALSHLAQEDKLLERLSFMVQDIQQPRTH